VAKKLLGTTVENSGRPLRIEVTSNDIRKGKKKDPAACAVAQTLLRSTNATEVRVHRGVTYLLMGKVWKKYKTSAAVRMETIIFDRGGEFMAGEYDLQAVPLSELIPKKKSNGSKGRTPKEAALSRRRRVIPGVRRSARQSEEQE
jgi:hypothetical protein